MTQTYLENKENIDNTRDAELTVLRDRLARVQRQYDALVNQKGNSYDASEQARQIQQLGIENERLSHTVKQLETSRNEQIANLVKANAELQNKILKLETSNTISQISENRVSSSQRLFTSSTQKTLLDNFYSITNVPKEWSALKDVILLNSGENRATIILQILLIDDLVVLVRDDEKRLDFIKALLVAIGKSHEQNLLSLRDKLIERIILVNEELDDAEIFSIVSLLSVLSCESILSRNDVDKILKSLCRALPRIGQVVFGFVERCLVHATAAEVGHVQSMPLESNVFERVAEILTRQFHKNGQMMVEESLEDLQIRSRCVGVIVAGIVRTRSVVALMNLRPDTGASTLTLGEKIFHTLFGELLRESRMRHFATVSESVYKKFLPYRVKIISGCWYCLTRLGAVWSETSLPASQSPLRDCAVLMPSIFGLIKDLMAHPTNISSPIDEIVCGDKNDLIYLKELQETVVGLETEVSAWNNLQ